MMSRSSVYVSRRDVMKELHRRGQVQRMDRVGEVWLRPELDLTLVTGAEDPVTTDTRRSTLLIHRRRRYWKS